MQYKKIANNSIKLLEGLETSGPNNSCPECCGETYFKVDRPYHKQRCKLASILTSGGVYCFYQSKKI